MKKFWKNWNQVVMSSILVALMVVVGVSNIVTETSNNLYLWLLGANFGVTSAILIADIKNAQNNHKDQ